MIVILEIIVFTAIIFFAVRLYVRSELFRKVGILWVVAMLLPDFWILVKLNWPETKDINLNLWLSKSYREYNDKVGDTFNVLWYIYGIGTYLANFILAVSITKIASLVHFKLYMVSIVFVFFRITQFGFWLYNKNTSIIANLIVYIFIIPIVVIFFLRDKHMGKLKQF